MIQEFDVPDEPHELPEGWVHPDNSDGIMKEFAKELTEGHLLAGVPVKLLAVSGGTDDVLLQHLDQPTRFTVIHLSWNGRRGFDSRHPWVEFDGTFEEFVAEEHRQAMRRSEGQ